MPHEEQRERALARGLTPSKAVPCPRTLAGLRCGWVKFRPCVCTPYRISIFDHCQMWKTEDGELVLTGEPYNLNQKNLLAFVDAIADLGLEVTTSKDSMWLPPGGSITLIQVKHKPAPSPPNAP